MRLLAGPPGSGGYERGASHEARLGARPRGGAWLVDALRESGVRGRGGAWFPAWRKWEAVARHAAGDAVVVVNGSEGEPLSAKDRVLLQLRPHLVLDGAMLAAESLGASEVVVYLSRASRQTETVLARAMSERADGAAVRVERTAHRYVAGESSAVVGRLSGGSSKPRFTVQTAAAKGVDGRPTLVQNAETLAHVAMVARYGSEWFRTLGTASCPGTTLMTLCGNVSRPGVYEVDLGATIGRLLAEVGGTVSRPAGALLGGYFGTWVAPDALDSLPLDVDRLRAEHSAALGCGVLAVLPDRACPIIESTRILAYLAAETAGQCGPCVNGLAALAESMGRIAESRAQLGDAENVWRWMDMVRGRGACHHPDGAIGQLHSALTVFEAHFRQHLIGRRCGGETVTGFPAPPRPGRGWR